MPKHPTKDRLVILVSSGDLTNQHIKRAGQLATDFKSSGRFAHVFFSGWLKQGDFEKNPEFDAIYGSNHIILYVKPFGKSNYEDFVARRHIAWKDEFVVGANSLLRKRGRRMKAKQVYAVFNSDGFGKKRGVMWRLQEKDVRMF